MFKQWMRIGAALALAAGLLAAVTGSACLLYTSPSPRDS